MLNVLSRDHCGDSPERPSGLSVSPAMPKKEKSCLNSFVVVFQVKGLHSEKYMFYILPITLWSFWESKKEK